MTAFLYLEHFTDRDQDLLVRAAGLGSAGALLSYLRANPGYLEVLLRDPALHRQLFGEGGPEALLRASPFLIFAVLVHRVAADLEGVHFVEEWLGPGRRVPMFDVEGIRSFGDDVTRRLFLAELLASYTRVASGSYWMQTARGWRRRRFSELDPLRMIELIEASPEAERPLLYRRLGDLALFLTGVFPDHTGRRFLLPVPAARLRRAVPGAESSGSPLHVLEEVGRRAYLAAGEAAQGRASFLEDVAASFGQARRFLNVLTDRHLFSQRDRWFPAPDS